MIDQTILASADTALQGIAPLLTIPVGVAALLFLGAKGVRITASSAADIHSLWFELLKLMIIIDLSLNIGDYDYYVRDFLYTTLADNLSGAIAHGVTGVATGVHGVAATIDDIHAQAWQWVSRTLQDAGLLDWGSEIAAYLCAFTMGCLLIAMAFIYLAARVLLAVILVFGPIAIACSMHRTSAPVFERWMGKCIALLCLQVMGILVLVMVLSADKYFLDQLKPALATPAATFGQTFFAAPWDAVDGSPAPTTGQDVEVLISMVLWFGFGAFLLYSLPALAYSIGTGIAVSFAPVALGLLAAGAAVGEGISAAIGSLSGFSGGGGMSGGGSPLSMDIAREDLEGSSGYDELPPPPPPPLSSASSPRLEG